MIHSRFTGLSWMPITILISSIGIIVLDTRSTVLIMPRMENIKIGIVDVRSRLFDSDVRALEEFIVQDRVAMLTGYFGGDDDKGWLRHIATKCGAVGDGPLHQSMMKPWMSPPGDYYRSCGWVERSPPTFFVLFGIYRSIKVPEKFTNPIPETMPNDELWHECVGHMDIPSWPLNDHGSAFVANLGNVKMKHVDFSRWCHHTMQTCIWLGTSMPSKSSQARCIAKRKSKGQWKRTW